MGPGRFKLERYFEKNEFFEARSGRLSWVRPSAGTIGFARTLEGSASALCEDVLRAKGVAGCSGQPARP